MLSTDPDLFAQGLARFEIELPAPAAAVLATRRAALTAATDDPIEALRADLEAGKVTAKNVAAMVTSAATGLIVREKAREVVRDLERTFTVVFRQAISTEAEAILIGLRQPWDEAVATLTVAREAFGDQPNADAIMNAGAQAANLWAERTAALQTIGAVRAIRVALAGYGYGGRIQHVSWYVARVKDAGELARAEGIMKGTGDTFGDLAGAGYMLRLNTAEEAKRVADGARLVTEQAEAEAREARLAAHRAKHQPEVDAWNRLVTKAG